MNLPKPNRYNTLFKITILFFIISLFVASFILIIISQTPYTFVQSIVDSFATANENAVFDSIFWDGITSRALIVGIGIFIVAVFVIVFNVSAKNAIFYTIQDAFVFIKNIVQRTYLSLRTDAVENKIALFLLTLAAIVLRLNFINQPMRYDEAWTYNRFASRNILIGMVNYSAPNNHIFHTILVHGSTEKR